MRTTTQMFDLMHEFRARIIASPAFTGERILGAILFEQTMDRDVDGVPTPQYLWERKQVVPFVKVDEGLADEADGVRLMKPFTRLDALLERAAARRVFGTKMRSFVSRADAGGIAEHPRSAVRLRRADPRRRPDADPRARDRHPQRRRSRRPRNC